LAGLEGHHQLGEQYTDEADSALFADSTTSINAGNLIEEYFKQYIYVEQGIQKVKVFIDGLSGMMMAFGDKDVADWEKRDPKGVVAVLSIFDDSAKGRSYDLEFQKGPSALPLKIIWRMAGGLHLARIRLQQDPGYAR